MNNPFEYTPDAECEEAFRVLTERLEVLKKSDNPLDVRFCRELEAGKMLGVLVTEDSEGRHHTLYAFSGQLGDSGFHHPGFVGPVFDYLQPDDYFKTKEADISHQNVEIALFEKETVAKAKSEYESTHAKLNRQILELKEKYRKSKLERDAKRKSGKCDKAETTAMIRQSQFEKAEVHRLKKRLAIDLEPYENKLKKAQSHLEDMKAKRRADSEALQKWLFDNFHVLNARGESRSLSEIFIDTPMGIPPSGAGECCAPKLLQAAYLQGWQPIAIAEYWYGKSKGGEVRIHGEYYPACRGKCLPVLGWMLQGLQIDPPLENDSRSETTHEPKIIFENQWFCVVDKPSGMLSVPGKGKAVSVQEWLENKYGSDRDVKVAHRLDQDTSGLLMTAFGPVAFKVMQSLFAMRQIKKTYIAVLDGDFESRGIPRKGSIELPLSPDWLDRPRQRIDFDSGKEAVTEYESICVSEGRSKVIFHPKTGRTHQLRVHSASEMGLGMPIAGDRLYGKNGGNDSSRLLLHAQKIEFTFPIDGSQYSFESPCPF